MFSLQQLLEKCRERRQKLFVAFINLTKAFDLVSKDGHPGSSASLEAFPMIRRTLWSLLAQCQTLLTSEVERNRASSSLQPYLEFSSLSCLSKHLEMQQRASTFGPGQTESSKSKWNVCVISSFPTVQALPPTQPKTFRSSWTASARPAKALDWPSALGKHRSWLRIWTHLPILQSWGMNGRLSDFVHLG